MACVLLNESGGMNDIIMPRLYTGYFYYFFGQSQFDLVGYIPELMMGRFYPLQKKFNRMKKKRSIPQNDIAGIILANKWDEDGNVIGVSVYTDQEEVYIVAQNKRQKELVKLIQNKVRVEGKIEEGLEGSIFYVKSFKTEE